MRIGVNTLFLIPGEVGGSEVYLRETLSAMVHRAEREVAWVIFTNRENDQMWRETLHAGGAVQFCSMDFSAANRVARVLREQFGLPSAARRAGLDVLWSPGYTAPLRCPCPQVVTLLDMQYRSHPDDFSWPARWGFH